jgi:hypothetical protein
MMLTGGDDDGSVVLGPEQLEDDRDELDRFRSGPDHDRDDELGWRWWSVSRDRRQLTCRSSRCLFGPTTSALLGRRDGAVSSV